MYATACLVSWHGSAAGWRMLALAMGEVPAAPCPAMEVRVEQQRADDWVVGRQMLRALLAAQAYGVSAATATARASAASGKPTPRHSATEIAVAALSAAGPPRDGPLHLREMIDAHSGDGERFRGEAVRLLGLHGVAGAKALRVAIWLLGHHGLLEAAPQPSGDEGAEEVGAPDIFRRLTPLGMRVAAQLGRGGDDQVAEEAISVTVASLLTAARGRGPLRAALEAPEVQRLRRIRRAMSQLEQRLRHSPRVHDLCAYGGQGLGRRCRSRAWPGAQAQGLASPFYRLRVWGQGFVQDQPTTRP